MENDLPDQSNIAPSKLTAAHIAGAHTSTVWSSAITITPPLEEEVHHDERISIVVSVARNDSQDAAFFGKALIEKVEHAYFAKDLTGMGPLDRLRGTVAKGLSFIQQEGDKLAGYGLLVMSTRANMLYAGAVGGVKLALFRLGTCYFLLENTINPQTVSGKLTLNDYLIAGTNNFFEHTYPTKEVFDGRTDAKEISSILSPLLLSLPENADIGACIISIGEPTVIDSPSPVFPTPPDPPPGGQQPNEPPRYARVLPSQQPTKYAPSPIELQALRQTAAEQASYPLEHNEPMQVPMVMPQLAHKKEPFFLLHKLTQHTRPVLYAIKNPKSATVAIRLRKAPIRNQKLLSKRLLVILGAIIVLALMIFLLMRFVTVRKNGQAAALYSAAQRNIAIAQSLKTQDPKRALTLLEEASNSIALAKKKSLKVVEPLGLENDLTAMRKSILAITAVSDPETFYNLALLKDSFNGTRLALSDSTFLAVDAAAPTLLQIPLTSKNGSIASGGSKLPNFVGAALSADKVLALTQSGVYKIDATTGDPKELIKKDALWNKVNDLSVYNGNIYVLDGGKGEIWKYVTGLSGTSSIKNVLNTDDEKQLIGAESFVIDGTFWVTRGNSIFNISGGKLFNYTVENLDKPFGNTVRLASATESDKLYILDVANGRVVVANKDGKYVSQLSSKAFADVVDIALSLPNKTLYLLTSTKILKVPITQ